jgi:hypothetical protein
VADADALHDGHGTTAEAKEMPRGGQAHDAAADHDRAMALAAHPSGALPDHPDRTESRPAARVMPS